MAALQQESKRQSDINGWVEVADNPISKVGVFPYLGKQIDPTLDPNKIYYVYRSGEELSNPETIDSFKLVPLINDHEMLGEDFTPAEYKGIDGVIGEDVYYDAPYLKANLKIFSEALKKTVDDGKRELSIGYRCKYDLTPGTVDGVAYDVRQYNIRGNHLAVVTEGRAGPDVAVLDHFKITFDEKGVYMENSNEVKKTETTTSSELTLESVVQMVKEGLQKLNDRIDEIEGAEKENDEKKDDEKEDKKEDVVNTDEDSDKKEDVNKDVKEDLNKDLNKDVKSMDAKISSLTKELNEFKKSGMKSLMRQVSERNKLVERVAPLIGTFDHAELTIDEVAKYALDKLQLKAQPGQEHALLEGYLAAKNSAPAVSISLDAKPKQDAVKEYLNKCK